ncbi:hypothetical protein PDE_08565 [Penicillium oxalicum 114-2]|uniref:GST N-terminal domain-containing protein n=1 Tax=Penicillium oxalicum (strain 114-2 / CGMCC 5302) TaxID=933388 RepID=S8B447_PENO1|nr:hypothetical protein PDE_08565 [Penicillium oxalicum 114-2]
MVVDGVWLAIVNPAIKWSLRHSQTVRLVVLGRTRAVDYRLHLEKSKFRAISQRLIHVHSTVIYLIICSSTRRHKTQNNMSNQKPYHTKATGKAAVTVADHSTESPLKLYGSCFCPFVQRVWIALEAKKIPYQYIEVDPYEKPQSLLEVNPRGLVPALRHDDWGCYESTVLMEYLEDLKTSTPLLPDDPKTRAHCRLWSDHINRHVVPGFYRLLQEQNPEKQVEHATELRNAFETLVKAAHPEGPFFVGPHISFVDVQVAPWLIRLRRVMKPYRGWPDAENGTRWAAWVNAVESNEHVQATTSTDALYLESYARYAGNTLLCPIGWPGKRAIC